MNRFVASMVVMVCLCGPATAAQAQEKVRVGVIDVRKVMFESKQGQQNRAELEKMVQERRNKLTKEDADIKKLHEILEKDKLVLTDKQREQKQKEIEERVGALQKKVQEAEKEVAQRENELSAKMSGLVKGVIEQIAKQEKLTLVIAKNQPGVLWVEEEVDITDRVIKAYEAKSGK